MCQGRAWAMLYTSAGLEKRGNVWVGYLSYKDELGKWRKKKRTFSTKYKRDASKMLNEWRDREETKAEREASPETVQDAVTCFLGYQRCLGLISEVTYQRNMRQAEYAVFPYIGDIDFYDITSIQLQVWINTLSSKYAASSISTYYAIFSKAYRYAFKNGKIIKDARVGVVLPKQKGRHRIAYLDCEGRKKLNQLIEGGEVKHARNNDLYIPIAIAYYGGLRAGEICALKWQDIDFNGNVIRVTKSAKQVKNDSGKNIVIVGDTKTYSARAVPIIPQLKNALLEQIALNKPRATDWLCAWRNPRHLGSAFQKWACRNKLYSSLNKPITIHGLRHSFATNAVRSKMDIKSLASILGHKDAKMTLNVYASDDEVAKQSNMAMLAEMLLEEEDESPRKQIRILKSL